jgi:hypothetical protein
MMLFDMLLGSISPEGRSGKPPLSLGFPHRVLHFASTPDLDHKLGEC